MTQLEKKSNKKGL